MRVINWELIAHPMNWVILFLMVLIGLFAIHTVLSKFSVTTT